MGCGVIAIAFACAAVLLASAAVWAETKTPEPQNMEQAEPQKPATVFDSEAGEWVTLSEYGRRLKTRSTRGVVIEQVPFSAPVIRDGNLVIDRLQDARQRHLDYLGWLREKGLL